MVDAARALRAGFWLEYATLGWNVAGTAIMLVAAVEAGSVALGGFGLDSAIEIFASVVVVWQLTGTDKRRERPALRLIGAAFMALAAYVLVQSAWALAAEFHPQPSPMGLLWLALTCIVMLGLAWGKRVIGQRIGNAVLLTEARVTLIDAALAASVLTGTGLDAALGWWWADPLAGLVIVYYGITEGRAAWRHGAS